MPKLANKKKPRNPFVGKANAESASSPLQSKVRIVSLFAGAGGMEIAACKTGKVEAIVSSDANATFLSTVGKNMPVHFPEVRHASLIADARKLKGATLKKLLGSTPDLVMGGPPCDDYTRFGRRRGFEGEKGPLIFEFLRLVEEIGPECFVFENVPNLAQQFKGVFELFMTQTRSMHYFAKWELLQACNYGAPTQRTRVFVVGWKSARLHNAFRFPDPTHGDPTESGLFMQSGGQLKPFQLVRDVLDGLPEVKTLAARQFLNHTGRTHRPQTVEHMKSVPIGKQVKQSFRYRAPWNGLTQSLTAGLDDSTKSHIHPHYHREMSVREYARLHRFPDTWFFSGTHHNGIKQVANSVPIPLGEAVLSLVISRLLEGSVSSNHD
jgi:DNA (cytosine-5)-methyltransferase 1